MPQQADFIIDLAESVDYLSDVIFLIIGNGTEKQNIVNIVREKQLSNVIIKDHLPRKDYQELVKQCDIGLVNLSNKFTYSNIPSRTLAYFEAKIPILAAVDDNEDYFLLLKRSKAGYCSVTGDLDDYKNNFLQMYNNREKNIIMGENGYVYLQKYMSVEKAYLSIMSHIKE